MCSKGIGTIHPRAGTDSAARILAVDLPVAAFEEVRTWWVQSLLAEHSQTDDAFSGGQLDVLERCVAVEIDGDPQGQITDYMLLAAWLQSEHSQRCAGGADLGDVHQERPCTWRSQRREGRLPHSNSGLHILDQDC